MSERQPSLGQTGKNGGLNPDMARRLLGWIEDLVGSNQEGLARRVGLDSRSLRNFAAGKGGRRTILWLAGAVPLPLWIVYETMLPVIAAVSLVWRNLREHGVKEEGAFLAARNGAMGLAARISVVEFLARRGRTGIEEMLRPRRGKGRESSQPEGEDDCRTWAGLHPADARVLIRWLQSLGGWTRRDLAARSGLSHETLRMYETGDWPLEASALCCLVGGAGLPLWLVEGVMLPAISAVRLVAEHACREKLLAGWEGALAAASDRIRDQQAGFPTDVLPVLVRQGAASAGPSAADRFATEGLWRRLEGQSPAERILLVKNCPEFHAWFLVERLCLESEEAASDSAKTAFGLVLLALRVARLVREEGFFRLQLEGFALLYVGNSLRVAGALKRAAEVFARGLELWEAGSGSNLDLLPAWRVPDLEGSLLRSQRRFDEALERIDRALAAAPREAWGRILIKKATVLDQKLEPEASIAVLREAAPLLEERPDPHLSFLWTSLMGVNYCHLERYREARELLPKAQELAARLRKALNNLRLEWLRGRIEAGLGHQDEALRALTSVQEELHKRKIAYDYALVSLEVGEILLARGRFGEVQELALKMEWIFKKEEIHQEAAKALDLFRRAVEGQTATPELARKVVRFLYRAQYNPNLQLAA